MTTGKRPPVVAGDRPVVGHTLAFIRDPLGTLEAWSRADAPVVQARVAGRRPCLVTGPAGARQVLATDSAAFRKAEVVRERLGTLQGGSLVLLEGDAWRERRRTLSAGFTPDRVASVGTETVRATIEAVEQWPNGQSFRVDESVRDLTLSVLARALFGLDLDGGATAVHAAADDVLARLDVRSPSAYLPEWVPTPTNRRFRRAVATLHERLDETVAARASSAEDWSDLLSTMLAAGLEPAEVRDELVAFLFAGFDSTATALSCTLGLLAANPDVQERVWSELTAELDGGTPTPDDLPGLAVLDAVVRESLRLFPPQYVLFREPASDVTVQGYDVDEGRMVLVAPWALHRDREQWADPGTFRPERWLDDGDESGEAVARPEHAYVPYGAGPRHCLGVRLANQTVRLVVAVVCQRRHLSASDPLSVTAGATLSLDGGVRLTAQLRE
jgi:cytochrome P450